VALGFGGKWTERKGDEEGGIVLTPFLGIQDGQRFAQGEVKGNWNFSLKSFGTYHPILKVTNSVAEGRKTGRSNFAVRSKLNEYSLA